MPQVANVNSSINIFLQQDQGEWINRNHFLISGGVEHQVFFMIFPFTYRYFPNQMNFCNKSQTSNQIPLIILSKKHAHYEHFFFITFIFIV